MECMLKKIKKKKEKIKDEAYYVKKIKELKNKTKNFALVATSDDYEDGTYQIWSSRFDDGEMRNLTHREMIA